MKVWAVITSFNEEDTIYEVTKSVLYQSHYIEKVVVVDDASRDQKLFAHLPMDERVVVVPKTKNKGVMDSIEVGTKMALEGGADLVVVVSAHVWVPKDWVAWVVRILESHPNAGLLQGPIEQRYDVIRNTMTRWQLKTREVPPWAHYQHRDSVDGAPPQPSLIAYVSEALRKMGDPIFHPEAYHEELIVDKMKRAGFKYLYIKDLPPGIHTVVRFGSPWRGLLYAGKMAYYASFHVLKSPEAGTTEKEARDRRGLQLGVFRPNFPEQMATVLTFVLMLSGGWVTAVSATTQVLRGIHKTQTRGPLHYSWVYLWYFILQDVAQVAGGLYGSIRNRRLAL